MSKKGVSVEDQLLIYFGSPYTDSDRAIMLARFEEIRDITEQVIRECPGIVPFSPIAYTHQFSHIEGIDWLARVDYRMLLEFDGLFIVQMQGWSVSEGVICEQHFAQLRDIPVFYAPLDRVVERCHEIWEDRKHLFVDIGGRQNVEGGYELCFS